jgi:glycosyltransferase involved in cell wall biosynthesis
MSRSCRVFIARMVHGLSEHPSVGSWLVRTCKTFFESPHFGGLSEFPINTSPVYAARNAAVALAKQKKADYLVMVDADMVPDCVPDTPAFFEAALHRAIEIDGPCVIAAPYPMLNGCAAAIEGEGDDRKAVAMPDAVTRDGFQRMTAVGTGLILIDMRCFDAISQPYFSHTYRDEAHNEVVVTDDVYFCDAVRAAGIPILTAWDSWAGHHKSTTLRPKKYTQAVAIEPVVAVNIPNNVSKTWAVTTYFNPLRISTKRKNYELFRQRLPVPLLTVEISADGNFELETGDADILLQYTGETRLFQKEAATNAGIKKLPPDCDNVVWVDADLIWESDAWVRQLPVELSKNILVQPFSQCIRLPKHRTYQEFVRYGRLPDGNGDGEVQASFAAWYRQVGIDTALNYYSGHVGFVWAARRDFMLENPLYDCHVVGGSDTVMAYGALGPTAVYSLTSNKAFEDHIVAWRRKWSSKVQGRVGYIDGRIFHLWHGDSANRQYVERRKQLDATGFDPSQLSYDANGLLKCSNPKVTEMFVRMAEKRQEELPPLP